MKYLITGISGFVGYHLAKKLLAERADVMGIDAQPLVEELRSQVQFFSVSLMDTVALQDVLSQVKPECIIHLASASSVGFSWQKPTECFVNNTNIFLNLVESVRALDLRCRILSVGSSEEYGPVKASETPLVETHALNPMNPYAVARVAQEQLSRVFASGYGMDIVCTRSFNHLGSGQTDRFVISSFVKQAVELSLGKRDKITCGNLDIIRDFMDVRDVIEAYGLVLDKGKSGDVYNVCSGHGTSLKEILAIICELVGVPFSPSIDPNLIRPIDNPVIVGSSEKIKGLGFSCQYDLKASLSDMVAWWTKNI